MPADRRIAARMGLGALSGYAWAMLSARALTRGFGHLTSVARQVAELIRSGAVVTVIEPDAAAVKAIGRNVLGPGRARSVGRGCASGISRVAVRLTVGSSSVCGCSASADAQLFADAQPATSKRRVVSCSGRSDMPQAGPGGGVGPGLLARLC